MGAEERAGDEERVRWLIVDAYLTEEIDELMLHDVLRNIPDEEVDELRIWIIAACVGVRRLAMLIFRMRGMLAISIVCNIVLRLIVVVLRNGVLFMARGRFGSRFGRFMTGLGRSLVVPGGRGVVGGTVLALVTLIVVLAAVTIITVFGGLAVVGIAAFFALVLVVAVVKATLFAVVVAAIVTIFAIVAAVAVLIMVGGSNSLFISAFGIWGMAVAFLFSRRGHVSVVGSVCVALVVCHCRRQTYRRGRKRRRAGCAKETRKDMGSGLAVVRRIGGGRRVAAWGSWNGEASSRAQKDGNKRGDDTRGRDDEPVGRRRELQVSSGA